MGLETATYISDLNASNPTGSDAKSTADDHLRLIKSVLKASFPNINGAVSATDEQLSGVSPAFTGTPTAPTAAVGTGGTQIATCGFVAATALSTSLPGQLGSTDYLLTTDGVANASWTNALKASVIRFKDGTDATKMLAFDVSGFTTGTTRTVTIPNKSGTMAMIGDAAFVLLATLTPTVAVNVDALSTFSATYDNYLIVLDGVKPVTDSSLILRLASGGVADSGSNYFSGQPNTSVTSASTSFPIGGSSVLAAGKGVSLAIHVLNANDSTNIKTIVSLGALHTGATPSYYMTAVQAAYTAANAVSGFRIYWSGGDNFAATGTVYVFGYKNS